MLVVRRECDREHPGAVTRQSTSKVGMLATIFFWGGGGGGGGGGAIKISSVQHKQHKEGMITHALTHHKSYESGEKQSDLTGMA